MTGALETDTLSECGCRTNLQLGIGTTDCNMNSGPFTGLPTHAARQVGRAASTLLPWSGGQPQAKWPKFLLHNNNPLK